MNSASLTIWCNAKFPLDAQELLLRGVGKHHLILAQSLKESNLVGSGQDHQARGADVALGQPHPDDVIASTSLKWIHLTSAGYTRYDRDDVKQALHDRGAVMTSSSGVYSDPCAQHVLAFMLSHARKLNDAQA